MGAAAHYRFEAQIITRAAGRSSVPAAAYRAAAWMIDERTGETHDYTRKSGVLHTEIMLPEGAPDWASDRAALWNAVEKTERRKDAQLARELLLSLPHQLTHQQRVDLVRGFVAEHFVAQGMAADIAVHLPHGQGDHRNHHAHVMLTLRPFDGEKFGPKAREWNARENIPLWRAAWADHQNALFNKLGLPLTADHRSHEERSTGREPEPKMGPEATAMERRGEKTRAGKAVQKVRARNAERGQLARDLKIIDRAIAAKKKPPSKQASAAAVEQTRAAIAELTEFDRSCAQINRFSKEISKSLAAIRRLDQRRRYADRLIHTVDENFHAVFRGQDKAERAHYRFWRDVDRHGIREACRRLQRRPQRYGPLEGWQVGSLYRSKDRRAAWQKLLDTAGIARQGYYMQRKLSTESQERAALEERIAALKQAQRQSLETPPEGRLILQRVIDRAARHLRHEHWARLSRLEKYHLMQARDIMRDAEIREYADFLISHYRLAENVPPPLTARTLAPRITRVDLTAVSTARRRKQLDQNWQEIKARHAKEMQALEAAGRRADAAAGKKRNRMTGLLALFIARLTGLDGTLSAYRAWKDGWRHRCHEWALDALGHRQESELVALRAQYQDLKRRKRRRGEGRGCGHDKRRGHDYRPDVRNRPRRDHDPGPEH